MTTLAELKQEAKKLKVTGYSRMRRDELEKALNKTKRQRAKNRLPMPTTVEEASVVLGKLGKGEARKLRKALRNKGRGDLAGAERVVLPRVAPLLVAKAAI